MKTRKDFIKMAEEIAELDSDTIREEMIRTEAQLFRASNPRFDEYRFREFIKKKRGGK